jgi:tripartite-type tricarboxylate transporter receptor subunit TctC
MTYLNRRRFYIQALCAGLLAMTIVQAKAQGVWPTQPIRIVVPFPPGGSNDVMARALSAPLSKALGEPVIVENRPGAGGTVGANYVARSKPDGYTLLLTTNALASASAVQKTPYDPAKDFDAVARLAISPFVIVMRDGFPASNVRELIEYAKANPGKISYGTTGVGDNIHLASASFAKSAGITMTDIPYKGTGPAIIDLKAGRIDLLFTSYTSVMSSVARTLPIIAVTSQQRNPAIASIPTLRESGVDYVVDIWWAVLGPHGLPSGVRERLNLEINSILGQSEFSDLLKQLAADAPPISANQMQQDLVKDVAAWRTAAEAADLKNK